MVKQLSGMSLTALLLLSCGHEDSVSQGNLESKNRAASSHYDATGGNASSSSSHDAAFEFEPLGYAETFTIAKLDCSWVVDLKANVATWGGSANGPEQTARMILVPREESVPGWAIESSETTVVRIPVQRIATNLAPYEAMLTALGEDHRLVAVGGPKSYNDDIRERVLAGEIEQIGYGWHMPPIMDALLGSDPDVMLMSMGDLSHRDQMDRIRGLGVSVFPMFVNSEQHYMGKVEYILLVGLLTGKYEAARDYVARVEQRVNELKQIASEQPAKKVISAWYSGSGRWMATVRNAENTLLSDANGLNLLEKPDDGRMDEFQQISTEQLIIQGAEADCAILRDDHSQPFTDESTLRQIKAYRERCVFAIDGMAKLEVDAYDYYERAVIRPDLLLADLVYMLHPALRVGVEGSDDQVFKYIRPDEQVYEQ